MKPLFAAKFDNDKRIFSIWQNDTILIADNIKSATWAECIVGWMNTLELQPEHKKTLLRLAEFRRVDD